ncbi:MAG TPA: (deoxy)nucleoside triphosphate pyrophosphohydrolase [Bacteroidota bacterium]
MQKAVVGVIMRDGKILVCQRKRGTRYGLQWEFPGGKVERGEEVLQTLERELQEELGIRNIRSDKMYTVKTEFPDGNSFDVTFCFVLSYSGLPSNREFESIRWVTPTELKRLDLLEGNKPIIEPMLHEFEVEKNRV